LLSISSAGTLTDRALAAIGALQSLAGLDVHTSVFGSPFYTARGVAHLKKMGALEALNFHGQLVNDAVLREIAAIPRLPWLHAQDVASGDDGFIALGRRETLETAALRFCHAATDRGVAALATLQRLQRRVLVNGRLRHTWQGDFAGLRSRLAIGPRRSALTVKSLRIGPLNNNSVG
jgi:hypothetical protein